MFLFAFIQESIVNIYHRILPRSSYGGKIKLKLKRKKMTIIGEIKIAIVRLIVMARNF